jgi:hypothetical protein
MDESVPFTKYMLDNLLGVVYSEADYQNYFNQFVVAQQRRSVSDASDRVKKGIDWRLYQGDFMRTLTHAEMPVVQIFKQNLKAANGQQVYGQQVFGQPNQYNHQGYQGGQSYQGNHYQKNSRKDCVVQ